MPQDREKRFHNPYNFVPVLPVPPNPGAALGHGKPKGHDKYHDGHWSGRIEIEIEVKTPLIVPTSSPVSRIELGNDKAHLTYGLRKYRDEDGIDKPLLPVTSLKGALRSAYEAVTNSRFGVFSEHDRSVTSKVKEGRGWKRRPAPRQPNTLVTDAQRPSRDFAELSPADRVFGWVAQERQSNRSTAAWRGQLRIHPIKCTVPITQVLPNGGLPLAILAVPKVQQARFYLAQDDGGKPLSKGSRDAEDGYFDSKGNTSWRLRGRKVYPHHRRLKESEYKRSTDPRKPTGDDQNRSIAEWIAPSTFFRTAIDVTNLRKQELGALLWLLDMNRWEVARPDEQGEEMPAHHRLGYGKPLGFGSVIVRITSLRLRDGAAKRREYETLIEPEVSRDEAHKERDQPTPDDIEDIVQSFRSEIEKSYGGSAPTGFSATPFIAAWLHAARGFRDGYPIHYPRERPDSKGEQFKWFMANKKVGLSLGDLVTGDEHGLPYLQK